MSSLTQSEETYKIEPLQGSSNYRTWKFSMRMVLQARDLWECPKWRARQEGWATGEEAFQPAQKEKTEKVKYAM